MFSRLSDHGRLWLGLHAVADGYGKGLADSEVIKGALFPFEAEITVQAVDAMLLELARARDRDGLPLLYLYGRKPGLPRGGEGVSNLSVKPEGSCLAARYFQLPRFAEDQRVDARFPSEYPNAPRARVMAFRSCTRPPTACTADASAYIRSAEVLQLSTSALDVNLCWTGHIKYRLSEHRRNSADAGGILPPRARADVDDGDDVLPPVRHNDEDAVDVGGSERSPGDGDSPRLPCQAAPAVPSPLDPSRPVPPSPSPSPSEAPGASPSGSLLASVVSSPLVPSRHVGGLARQAGRIETEVRGRGEVTSEDREAFLEFLAAVDWEHNGSFDAFVRLADNVHEFFKEHGPDRARRYFWGAIKRGGKFRSEHGKPAARHGF